MQEYSERCQISAWYCRRGRNLHVSGLKEVTFGNEYQAFNVR